MTGDIKIILPAPKKVVDDPAKKATEIAAKKLANQKLAQRFMMSLSADLTRLTFERYPELEQAYNGEYSGDLDLRSIQIINPEKVERAAGLYLDPARERSIARAKAVREANDPARAANRAIANAWRGRNFDSVERIRMKVKVQKFEGRAEYLRALLSKSVPAETLDKRNLTHGDVVNANSMLYEYWQLTRKADVDRALGQPAGQAAAKQSKDANAFRRFATGEGWSSEDHAQLVENIKRIKREFPAVVSNKSNSDAIAEWLLDQKRYPTYANMLLAATTLASEGKLLLNPSAVGIPEDRYGDSIEGAYQISRVSADDLRRMTTPYSAPAATDESKLSADEYWAAHPELAAERHKHDRAVIEREAVRKAESEVERFLMTQLYYQPTANNKRLMLDFLESHNLPLTAEALFEAFNALKPDLAQSDKGISYGATTVVAFDERNQNPSYISTELRDSIRRKIARYTSSQYQDWLVRHPEEAALLDD